MLPKILTQRNSRYKCHTVEEVVEMGVDCLELTQMAHLIHLSYLHQACTAAMQMLPFIYFQRHLNWLFSESHIIVGGQE